jgi:hypothetical protein
MPFHVLRISPRILLRPLPTAFNEQRHVLRGHEEPAFRERNAKVVFLLQHRIVIAGFQRTTSPNLSMRVLRDSRVNASDVNGVAAAVDAEAEKKPSHAVRALGGN